MRTPLLIILPFLLLSACAPPDANPGAPGLQAFHSPNSVPWPAADQGEHGPFIRGTARVVSVDQTTGGATLDYQGALVRAYWQTEIATAQGGIVTQAGAFKPPVGQYRPPDVRTQEFAAKPGDTIGFVGMRTGNSIFLQSVAVLAP